MVWIEPTHQATLARPGREGNVLAHRCILFSLCLSTSSDDICLSTDWRDSQGPSHDKKGDDGPYWQVSR